MFLRTIAVFTMMLIIALPSCAQQPAGDARSFFNSLIGDWIGICEQSTDGEQAENKYFHAVVKQVNDDTYTTNFSYYRFDVKTGTPVHIGNSTVTTTIRADGSVENKITGKGTVMVDEKPKNQEHELVETLICTGSGSMQGEGKGKLSVFGMPFGVGKNGKISDAKSTWSLANDTLTIDQTLTAGFRALIFSKKFSFEAKYTAKRGSNVASLWARDAKVSYKPAS